MMVRKLEIDGLKGLRLELEPGRKTLILGPNRSGKTAIRQALALGFGGLDPETGARRPGEILDLAQGSSMEVGIELDSGLALRRRYEYRPGSGPRSSLQVGPGRGSVREQQALLAAAVGPDPMLLDVERFAAASDAGRVELAFEKLMHGETGLSRGELMDRIGSVGLGSGLESELRAGASRADDPVRGLLDVLSLCRRRLAELNRRRMGVQAALELGSLSDRSGFELESERLGAWVGALRRLVRELGPSGLMGREVGSGLLALRERMRGALELFGLAGEPGFRFMAGPGAGRGVFGLERGSGFVGLDALSGGERLIFTAALAVAFPAPEPAGLRLLVVDELNRIDNFGGRRDRFVSGLAAAADLGLVSQVMAMSSSPAAAPAGVKLVELAAREVSVGHGC